MEQTLRNRSVGKKAIITFFVIVILLSAVVETLICRGRPGLALIRFAQQCEKLEFDVIIIRRAGS